MAKVDSGDLEVCLLGRLGVLSLIIFRELMLLYPNHAEQFSTHNHAVYLSPPSPLSISSPALHYIYNMPRLSDLYPGRSRLCCGCCITGPVKELPGMLCIHCCSIGVLVPYCVFMLG